MNSGKKVVLAYSGGLDTSVAIKWLMERGYEVVCYMGDVGQQADLGAAQKKAIETGASKCIVGDLRQEFVQDYAFRSLKTGALYQGKYNLATSLSRPLIAENMIKAAREEGARAVAHGCTGKGNDQVRFEVTFQIMMPEAEIIAPVRTWELTTRESEMEYAREHGIDVEQTREKPYSIDRNVWGISVEGGRLEDPWQAPGEDTYVMVTPPERTPDSPCEITLGFSRGLPVSINGKKLAPFELVEQLNRIAAEHGVGRVDMVEDRLVGIKSREIYEAPASDVLYKAHQALEELVLDREVQQHKKGMAQKYSRLIYNGLWFTPLKQAIDAFVDTTQQKVNGEVKVRLFKGTATVTARKSPDSLYRKELATYGEGDIFDQSLARGFIDLWGLPFRK